MKCPSCGKKLKRNTSFCAFCGQTIGSSDAGGFGGSYAGGSYAGGSYSGSTGSGYAGGYSGSTGSGYAGGSYSGGSYSGSTGSGYAGGSYSGGSYSGSTGSGYAGGSYSGGSYSGSTGGGYAGGNYAGGSYSGSTGGSYAGGGSADSWGSASAGSAGSWGGATGDTFGMTSRPKKKTNLGLIIGIAAAVLLIAGLGIFFGLRGSEKNAVKRSTEKFLNVVKSGPSEDTLEQVASSALPSLFDGVIGSILSNVHGSDLKDIYQGLMSNMSYEIQDIEKVDDETYVVTVKISNLNNKFVALRAGEMFVESYTQQSGLGLITQAIGDLASDKSKLVAEYLEDASDELAKSNDPSVMIGGTYRLSVIKESGGWVVNEDFIEYAMHGLGLQ